MGKRMIDPLERQQMIEVFEAQLALLQRDSEIINVDLEEIENLSQELSIKMDVLLRTIEYVQGAINTLRDEDIIEEEDIIPEVGDE